MKVYCRQMSPEFQDSALHFSDDFLTDDIAVCGNRDFMDHVPEVFKRVQDVLHGGDLADVIDDMSVGGMYSEVYKNVTDAINDWMYPEKERYSTMDVHKIKQLVFDYMSANQSEEDEILCEVLSIVTGKNWDSRIIRGVSQSDWNYVYYATDEFSEKDIEAFEVMYFNTGTEWIIDDQDFDPETDKPEDIEGYDLYVTSWHEEDMREEIAAHVGVAPEDVVMYAIEGYGWHGQYREVA